MVLFNGYVFEKTNESFSKKSKVQRVYWKCSRKNKQKQKCFARIITEKIVKEDTYYYLLAANKNEIIIHMCEQQFHQIEERKTKNKVKKNGISVN